MPLTDFLRNASQRITLPRCPAARGSLTAALIVSLLFLAAVVTPTGEATAASVKERSNAASARIRNAQKKTAGKKNVTRKKVTPGKNHVQSASVKSGKPRVTSKKKRSAAKRTHSKSLVAKKSRSTKARARKSSVRKVTHKSSGRKARRNKIVYARPTLGTVFGLHQTDDPLDLRSSVAYVYEPGSGRVLFEKNSQAVLPIASITKLMTAIVILDAGQSMREMLTISSEDIDRLRHSSSRLSVGTRLSRSEMLQLALMSSANRAAHALGRHYPGGMKAFVSAMNAKAMMFGMSDTRYEDPTGLSGGNVSSATDLARLVEMASEYPKIREYSTSTGLRVDTGYRRLSFHNTNRLIANQSWSIGLQKTGYIAEAGRCLVMQARISGRDVIMVLLDSNGTRSRFADAGRLRKWLQRSGPQIVAASEPAAIN